MMNVFSTFSGVGGLDLGLEMAGMHVVGQVEIDEFCRRVLAKHWPEVDRHDDVRTCVEWWFSKPRPLVDLVAAGFPCQPASVAGRRRGDTDDRWLWPETWAVINAIRPRWVVLENVSGLLTVRLPGRRDLDEYGTGTVGIGAVLGDLVEGGYDTQWDHVPASAVGAPHRRDRWWCIARLADAAGPGHGQDPRVVPGDARGDGRRGPDVGELSRGGGADVADTDSAPRRPEAGYAFAGAGQAATGLGSAEPRRRGSCDVGDAEGDGWGAGRTGGSARAGYDGPDVTAAGLAGGFGRSWPAPTRSDWWSPQSGMDRDPDGVSPWLDRGVAAPWERGVPRLAKGVPDQDARLRALGNAVVPQVAEHVGRLVMAAARADVAAPC